MQTQTLFTCKFSDFIGELINETKSKKFRVGFLKKNGEYRVGHFDLKYRSKWKQDDGTIIKRKGKKRTTDPNKYLLAHDLKKGQPRNINYDTMKWISVGKKVFIINDLLNNDTMRISTLHKVKFTDLKKLINGKLTQ